MQSSRSIKNNYFYNLIFQILSTLTPLLTAPYVSRTLGPDKVGIFSFCNSFALYFMIFIAFGFNMYLQTLSAKKYENTKEQSADFFGVFVCKGIMFIFSILMYFLMSVLFFKHYFVYFIVFSLNLFSTFFDFTGFLMGKFEYKFIALRGCFFKILYVLLIYIFVKNTNDLWIYCLIFVSCNLLSNILLISRIKKYITYTPIKDIKIKKHFIGAFKFFIPSFSVTLFLSIDKTLIGLLVDGSMIQTVNGTETIVKISELENGFFEEADKLLRIVLSLLTSFNTIMLSTNTYNLSVGKNDDAKNNLNNTIKYFLLIGIPMALGLISISDNLVSWFFGDKFLKTAQIIKFLSPLIVLSAINNCIGYQYLYPSGMQTKSAVSIVVSCALATIIAVPLINNYHSIGAAVALIIYDLILLTINYYMIKNIFSLWPIIILAIKYLFLSLIMIIPIVFINNYYNGLLSIIISLIVGVLVYIIGLLIIKDDCLKSLYISYKKRGEKNENVN